ncbi:MAG TPA: choice-of-anchor D domain-containing protein [Nitrospirae bacterium]|nr:choice-of-anchor D domain-containing protein [Nitrospirota bacterium]
MKRTVLRISFFIVLFVLSNLMPAGAVTFTVDTANDTVDASPGDGACADTGGSCSLRAAVMEANALAGADVVNVPAGTYMLTIAGTGEDASATGDLDIIDDLTINGAGAGSTVIDGGSIDRVFHVVNAVPVTFDKVTIQNGFPGATSGGGVLAKGDLTITNSTIDNNSGHICCSGGGGGLYVSGALTITNSTISNNFGYYGGGVYVFGPLTITNSTISGNTSDQHGAGVNAYGKPNTITGSTFSGNTITDIGHGGGLFLYVHDGTTTITNSTFSNNQAITGGGLDSFWGTNATLNITGSTFTNNVASNHGGGIAVEQNTTTLNITDSTIDGNSNGDGAGVYTIGPLTITRSTISNNSCANGCRGGGVYGGATTAITNSTISGNRADPWSYGPSMGSGVYIPNGATATITNSTIYGNINGGGGNGNTGGGVAADGSLTITNSIVAGNTGWKGNCDRAGITSGGYNIEDTDNCGFNIAGDQVNVSIAFLLDTALTDNGGPTQTHALLAGSPAIDAGDSTICAGADVNGVDQRGFPRSDGACDIGAYEDMTLYTLTLATSGTGSGSAASSPGKINCPGTCSDQIGDGTVVTLSATPDANSMFSGWSGDADCPDGEVTMVADTDCTAAFIPVQYTLTVNINPSGGGTVTGAGINCPGDCTEPAASGTTISLTATETAGYTFSSWSGCDTPSGNQCDMTMDADKTVTAVFVVPDITVSPTSIDFGSVTEGSSSTETVTVTNDGNADLTIGTVNTIGAPFGIVNDTCSARTLTPTVTCTFNVRFAPSTTGSFNNTLDIPSDDPDENPVTVSVSGTGVAAPVPDIDVTDSMGDANDLHMPFPDTTEGLIITTETVTISNTGNAILSVSNIELTGTNPGEFTFDVSAPTSCLNTSFLLTAGGNCTVTVTFSPTTTGSMSATLAISSDDPDEPTVNVALTGTGLSSVVNNPPDKPQLVYPANGQQYLPTTVTFEWTPVTDPDGDPVTYDIYYCEDNDPYNNCTSVQVASLEEKTDKPLYAGFGYGGGMILFGIVFAAGFRDRKRIGLLALMFIFAGALLVSCGSHNHDSNESNNRKYTVTGLNSGAAYYWGVAAKDDNGAETQSDVWKFTTR